MEKKKKGNLLFKVLGLLFFVYISLLIAFESGYYQTKSKNKALMTKEAMEEFESDLKNGENVDIKNYLQVERVDYSTKIGDIGNKVSNGVSDVMTKGIDGLFDVLKNLFW